MLAELLSCRVKPKFYRTQRKSKNIRKFLKAEAIEIVERDNLAKGWAQ